MPELRQIVGLRNRVIQGYDAVDDEIVWDIIIESKIPGLLARLETLLAEVDPR